MLLNSTFKQAPYEVIKELGLAVTGKEWFSVIRQLSREKRSFLVCSLEDLIDKAPTLQWWLLKVNVFSYQRNSFLPLS